MTHHLDYKINPSNQLYSSKIKLDCIEITTEIVDHSEGKGKGGGSKEFRREMKRDKGLRKEEGPLAFLC